jgi:Concanavalin A-like lectin/glucanases superfamily
MATITTNTTITLPAGQMLVFGLGGSATAIIDGNVYELGLGEKFFGPFTVNESVQVVVRAGTITYNIETDGAASRDILQDPISRQLTPDSADAVRGAVVQFEDQPPRYIGGQLVGAAGTGVLAGLKLADGDDFDTSPSRWSGRNMVGRYSTNGPGIGFRRTVSTDQAMYVDPQFRGWRSSSPAPMGYDGVSVSGSVLTLTASSPDSSLQSVLPPLFQNGSYYGRPVLVSGSLKTWPSFMFSAGAKFAVRARVQFAAGVARGYWPSLWTSSAAQNWPDFQEADVLEGIKASDGAVSSQYNVNGSAADGGANSPVTLAVSAMPTDRMVELIMVVDPVGGVIRCYDDSASAGNVVLVATYTNARVNRFRGAQDVRIDLAVSAAWDSSVFTAADWPKTFRVDYWQAWVPDYAGENTALRVLPAVMTTPGGSWAATLPTLESISGGKPGREIVLPVFDNYDCPGSGSRVSRPTAAGGMVVDQADRTISGTVPPGLGGCTGVLMSYAFDDGTPAARVLLPYYVAPAVQPQLFEDQVVAHGASVALSVRPDDFHSGNLGPHTYQVSVSGGNWLTVAGNGTNSVSISGVAPASNSTVSLSIVCRNAAGQQTQIVRTVSAAAAEKWSVARAADLIEWWDASDASTVYSDHVGDARAAIGAAVYRVAGRKAGHPLVAAGADNGSTTQPTYVTDALVGVPALKFVAANTQRLACDVESLVSAVSGSDVPYTLVMALRRGAPGVSVTPASFTRLGTQNDSVRHYISGANAAGVVRASNNVQANSPAATANMTADDWYIVAWVFKGAALDVYVNGAKVGADVACDVASLVINRFVIGTNQIFNGTNSASFDGSINAVGLFSGGYSANVQAAQSLLAARLGIALS